MREAIETVPLDGTAVIVEDKVTGRYELVRWSAEQSVWTTPDGSRCDINPSCWFHMRARYSQPVQQAAGLTGAEVHEGPSMPQLVPLGAVPVLPVRPIAEPTTLTPPNQLNPDHVHARQANRPGNENSVSNWKSKLALGSTLIVASLAGLYFRPDVVALTNRPAEQDTVRQISSTEPVTTTTSADTPKIANDPGSGEQRTDAPVNATPHLQEMLEKQTAQLRQELAESQRREEMRQLSAAELQRLLEQAREKISTMENQLAQARQPEKPVLSRKQSGRAQRHNAIRAQRTFFGAFGSTQAR